jgi:hypothetical protein
VAWSQSTDDAVDRDADNAVHTEAKLVANDGRHVENPASPLRGSAVANYAPGVSPRIAVDELDATLEWKRWRGTNVLSWNEWRAVGHSKARQRVPRRRAAGYKSKDMH